MSKQSIDFETDLKCSYIDTQKHVFKLKLFSKPGSNDILEKNQKDVSKPVLSKT